MPLTNIIPENPHPECVLIKFHKKVKGIGVPCNSCTNNQLREKHDCPILAGATLAEIYKPILEKAIQKGLETAFNSKMDQEILKRG